MKPRNIVLSLALTMVCATVLAQWQWIDRDGRKVYSDRGPPPEIPEKNILKRPFERSLAPTTYSEAVPSQGATPVVTPPPPASAPKTALDKELEAKKKAAADAELAKKKAHDERMAKERSENCSRAKQARATLDSGIRIARVNSSGEREILDDAARAEESKRIQVVIASDCSP